MTTKALQERIEQLEKRDKARSEQIRSLQQAVARLTGHEGEITPQQMLEAVERKDQLTQDLYWQQQGYG